MARIVTPIDMWRDLGYAIGALSAGLIADRFGLSWAITSIAALTFVSGAIVAIVMQKADRGPRQPSASGR
jgi:predicted MFS family arabinose efflux permease